MFHWLKRAASSIANASPGKLRLYADAADNLFKTRDEAGVVRVLGDGITTIALVSTVGRVKTYRITRQSGETFDYTVTDGQDGAVTAFNGRTGNITPQQADYDAFFLTQAEGDAAYQPLDSDLSAIAALATTPYGRNQLTYAGSAAATAALDLATSTLKGLFSPSQFSIFAGFFGQSIYFVTGLVDGSDGATVSGAQATANRQAIQAQIDAASSAVSKKPGGIVMLPPGTFHIDTTLTISTSAVVLAGSGGLSNTDIGSQTGRGTTLFWNSGVSAAGVAMVDVISPTGSSNPAVKRAGVRDLSLQCAGGADIGLRVRSIHFGRFENLYIVNPQSIAMLTECLVTGTQLGEAADVTKSTFDNISVRLLESPATARGFVLDGASNANTSNSTFRNLAALCTAQQIALDVRNTDSNSFYDIRINQTASGTVQPVRIRGGSAVGLEARGNVFFYLAAGGSSAGTRGVYSEGTEIGGVTAPAKNNAIFGYSIENGEPFPVIGTGSTLRVEPVGGTSLLQFNDAYKAVGTAVTAATDTDLVSVIVNGNAAQPGTTFTFSERVLETNGTTASTLNLYLKVNGTKVLTAAIALGTAAQTNRPVRFDGEIVFKSIGATGSYLAVAESSLNSAAGATISTAAAGTAINTTAAVTLTLGVALSATVAGVSYTPLTAHITKAV